MLKGGDPKKLLKEKRKRGTKKKETNAIHVTDHGKEDTFVKRKIQKRERRVLHAKKNER